MQAMHLPDDIDRVADALGDVADDFAGKTILLGGGCGFLGRYFQAVIEQLGRGRLKDNPCRLIAVDNLSTSEWKENESARNDHTIFIKGDVSGPIKVDGPIDFVVNAAGIPSPFYYRAFPLETLDASIKGTRNLLEIAREKGARFTFFSSSEIYGDPDVRNIPTQESYRGNVACLGPRACYDESKRVGETHCYIYHTKYGIPTSTIRPFNVYGPGMSETDYRVLPNFASGIKGRRPLKIYGSGEQTRTYCYVTDAMNGFMRVIARAVPGEAYNIGNPEPEIGVVELVHRVESLLGRPVPYDLVEYPDSYPADEPQRRCPDIRKARLQLHYHPTTSLDEGLKRFFAWSDKAYTGSPI